MDVIDSHGLPSLVVSLLLGLASLYVFVPNVISDELRRGDGSSLHLRKLILGIQRIVIPNSCSFELHAIWLGAFNVIVAQVVFRLVQPDVECPRA